MPEYTLKDLQKDLKRLDKRLTDLTEGSEKEDKIIDYLTKDELTEKLIMPVYVLRRVELYAKYFGTNQKVKVDL